MARVTVEDCIKKVKNRFELVLLAAKRARQLSYGAPCLVEEEERDKKDKNPVTALREIAAGCIDLDALREEMIKHHQKHAFYEGDDDETDEEIVELMAGEAEWVPQEAPTESSEVETETIEEKLDFKNEVKEEETSKEAKEE